MQLTSQSLGRDDCCVEMSKVQVTHVAKLHDMEDLNAMKPFLREAYEFSVSS